MRYDLGYDELFDASCYSCELGVAKPDPRFFTAAATLIGAEPAEMVLIDDNATNVVGARTVGYRAICWHLEQGIERLREQLHEVGVPRG
jgi:putative hydrolase of the HAD superfamily